MRQTARSRCLEYAAEGVTHRQRLALGAVLCAPPALEIDRPHVVGRLHDWRRSPDLREHSWTRPPPAPLDAAVTLHHALNRARRRGGFAVLPSQNAVQLSRAPASVSAPQLENLVRHLRRRLVGRRQRTSGIVGQAVDALCSETLEPFVASLPTDAVLTAQLGHRRVLRQHPQDELFSHAHNRPLGPWHPVEDASRRSMLSPMS